MLTISIGVSTTLWDSWKDGIDKFIMDHIDGYWIPNPVTNIDGILIFLLIEMIKKTTDNINVKKTDI